MLDNCTWLRLFGFNNKGGTWFEGVTLENFAAYTARVGTPAPDDHEIIVAFGLASPGTFVADLAKAELALSVANIRRQNPETLAIPDVRDRAAAELTKHLYQRFQPFGQHVDRLPYRDFLAELHMSDKKGVFGDEADGVPVYEGRMVDFFDHRAKRYVSGHGNSSVWEETPFGDERKAIVPQWRVAQHDLPNNAVRKRVQGYRVGFMDIADPGRQRSLVSCIIPPGTVCGHTVPTLVFPGAPEYMPIFLCIANSLILDFLARQRVTSKHMTFSIMDSLPIARVVPEHLDGWLTTAALLLTCTSPEMHDLWHNQVAAGWSPPVTAPTGIANAEDRRLVRARIDAVVARNVYGLERSDLELVLSNFPQLEGIEEKRHGEYLTARLILGEFDRLQGELPPFDDVLS